jgi:hypothetical protein
MDGDLNYVSLTGTLERDPITRFADHGTQQVHFTLKLIEPGPAGQDAQDAGAPRLSGGMRMRVTTPLVDPSQATPGALTPAGLARARLRLAFEMLALVAERLEALPLVVALQHAQGLRGGPPTPRNEP